MLSSKSLIGFWKSPEVRRLIETANGCIKPIGEHEAAFQPWQLLHHDIIRLNSRGDDLVPSFLQGVQSYCLEELPFPKNDGSATYLSLRHRLGVFADLLKFFRRTVERVYGFHFWQKAAIQFEDDPQASVLFGLLRQVSATTRPQAVNCLEQISRRGLLIEWSGGIKSCFRARDCGMKAIVEISRQMLAFLDNGKHVDPEEFAANKKRVIVDSVGPNLITVRYQGKTEEFTGLQRRLLLCLFWHKDQIVPFEAIWDFLYSDKTETVYQAEGKGGPPGRLRRQKSDLDKKLRQKFGPLEREPHWIKTYEGQGYRLNSTAVDWQKAPGIIDNSLFTRDPQKIDGHTGGLPRSQRA